MASSTTSLVRADYSAATEVRSLRGEGPHQNLSPHAVCGGAAESRFAVGRWETRAAAPVLTDAQAAIVCRKEQELEYGTHTIFMGRIVSIATNGDVDPLIYVDGQYTGRAA